MNVAFTRAAWKGIKEFSSDPQVRITVDNTFALNRPLSGPRSPHLVANLPGPVLSAALDAYRAWATAHGLGA